MALCCTRSRAHALDPQRVGDGGAEQAEDDRREQSCRRELCAGPGQLPGGQRQDDERVERALDDHDGDAGELAGQPLHQQLKARVAEAAHQTDRQTRARGGGRRRQAVTGPGSRASPTRATPRATKTTRSVGVFDDPRSEKGDPHRLDEQEEGRDGDAGRADGEEVRSRLPPSSRPMRSSLSQMSRRMTPLRGRRRANDGKENECGDTEAQDEQHAPRRVGPADQAAAEADEEEAPATMA